MIDHTERWNIVLSVLRSLLGAVTPNLRAVATDWDESEIRVYCYFDGEVGDDDKERMSVASTEVATDFLDIKTVQFIVNRIDAPARLPGHTAWIFLRAE